SVGMHRLRGALFLVFLFVAINLIWTAQGQSPADNRIPSISELSSNRVPNVNGVKTVVRIHDGVERPQIALPQQNYRLTSNHSPSGEICGVESRAAHGQIAPNTNGGTLNPVAFANPTTVNASGRVAFNSQVNGSDRNQGVFIANSDG